MLLGVFWKSEQVSRSVFEGNTPISGICSLQRAPQHGTRGCHFNRSACDRELSHLQLSTQTGSASAGKHEESLSSRSAKHTLVLRMLHCFLLLKAEHTWYQMLLWDVGRQIRKSGFFSLPIVWGYITYKWNMPHHIPRVCIWYLLSKHNAMMLFQRHKRPLSQVLIAADAVMY